MSAEDKELLERALHLAEENNTMLHSIRRTMRLAQIFRAIYWVFVIGLSIGAIYYIQPYLDQLFEAYGTIQSGFNSVQGVINSFGR